MQASFSGPARRSKRVVATIPISLLLQGEDPTTAHPAHTVDISHEGVRILTDFVLSPGQKVRIVVEGVDSAKVLPSHVVWATQPSVAESLAGIEFLETTQA